MRIHIDNRHPLEVVQLLRTQLSEAGLDLDGGLKLEFRGKNLKIKIQKLGTSTLTFKLQQADSGVPEHAWQLIEEEIALTHRPFQKKLHHIIRKMIEEIGGKITDTHS